MDGTLTLINITLDSKLTYLMLLFPILSKVLSIDESGPNQEEVLTGWQQQSIQVQSEGIDNIGSSTADGVAKERQNEMGQQCERRENLICFGGISTSSSVLKSRCLVKLFCWYIQKIVDNAEHFLDLKAEIILQIQKTSQNSVRAFIGLASETLNEVTKTPEGEERTIYGGMGTSKLYIRCRRDTS
ncbi:hypothetical protein MTR67_006979 [Solanum verrucosum]|uniref:Uncharacterized protein n=1 Tax=Solanum verrucosum TaxID=315347 RepID=A0AAF0Q565_SOLVR|nr:hypothetical protein MTR67_006979 [Solanum verrucosum]